MVERESQLRNREEELKKTQRELIEQRDKAKSEVDRLQCEHAAQCGESSQTKKEIAVLTAKIQEVNEDLDLKEKKIAEAEKVKAEVEHQVLQLTHGYGFETTMALRKTTEQATNEAIEKECPICLCENGEPHEPYCDRLS